MTFRGNWKLSTLVQFDNCYKWTLLDNKYRAIPQIVKKWHHFFLNFQSMINRKYIFCMDLTYSATYENKVIIVIQFSYT